MAKTYSYTWKCPECQCEVVCEFDPGRQAPACSNPDSPAFSDSGDPAELDIPHESCPDCGEVIDYDKALDHAIETVEPDDDYPEREDFEER
jgi:hypothetical protein